MHRPTRLVYDLDHERLHPPPSVPPEEMNPDLTIAQARRAKARLEQDIGTLLRSFTRETGARVEGINVNWMEIMGGRCRYTVHTEIKL